MATNMNQLTPEQRSIVNEIIAIGKQLGAPNEIIMAAINIANAESAFKPDANNGVTPTTSKGYCFGLYEYKRDTWDPLWKKFVAANPDNPISAKYKTAYDALHATDPAPQIYITYGELNKWYSGYDQGKIAKSFKPGGSQYWRVTALNKAGISIQGNFLEYAYLRHNTVPSEIEKITKGVFTCGNLVATKNIVLTQLGQGTQGSGFVCPGQPADTGLPYTGTDNATLTSRFYQNGVLYVLFKQTRQEWWSIPTEMGGSLDVNKFSNGFIVTQTFDAAGHVDTTVPGSIALDATVGTDTKAAFDAWVAAGNDPANIPSNQIYLDDGSGTAVDARAFLTTLVGGVPTTTEVASNDILIGNSMTVGGNMLVGGMGNDLLIGGSGNDVLWGGAGNDVMAGGAGNDTYMLDGGGHDIIEDKQGNNRVFLNGKVLFEFTTGDGINYLSTDGAFSGIMSNGDFIVTDNVTGDQVTLNKNFQSGDFGINLGNAPVASQPTYTVSGDPLIHSTTIAPGGQGPDWHITQAYNYQYVDDGNGNLTLVSYDVDYYLVDGNGNPTETGGPERADTLQGTAANDRLIGLGGDDTLNAWNGGGNDTLEGGTGRDRLYAGDGNDILSGNDILTALGSEALSSPMRWREEGNDVEWRDAA